MEVYYVSRLGTVWKYHEGYLVRYMARGSFHHLMLNEGLDLLRLIWEPINEAA